MSQSKKEYTTDTIKAENTTAQVLLRLFDGSTKPKIIKPDKVVGKIRKSGSNTVSTYKVIADKIVSIKINPNPREGSETAAKTGFEIKYKRLNASEIIKKVLVEFFPKSMQCKTKLADPTEIIIKIKFLMSSFMFK